MTKTSPKRACRVRPREGGRARVIDEHVDDGLTGALRNRPEFIAWLDDARECRASTLIAWHVDRMTREGVNVAAAILDVAEGKDPETGKAHPAPNPSCRLPRAWTPKETRRRSDSGSSSPRRWQGQSEHG
ncbi:recombinase family protein [Kribbella orskensis]|uniref:recombinase family protein n=1 Tax=Kribbella TaxID=182639 RepID=UPI0010492418